jgi:hypothetical protein
MVKTVSPFERRIWETSIGRSSLSLVSFPQHGAERRARQSTPT